MKKISIIMGIYNCSSTLPEAVNSIINQTYNNWELIMCDDGSSDDTYFVAKTFADNYSNIILIKNESNMGLNYTLNRCLDIATGEYIARMDGDDVSLPTRLEKELHFLETRHDYAFVGTPMIYFNENGDFGIGLGDREPQCADFVYGSQFSHATVLVRKEIYDIVGGYSVSKSFLRVEDWHLWIKIYSKGYRGYILSEALYKMRDDGNALRRRKFKYRINEARVICLAVKELNLPAWKCIFAVKPILTALLPKSIYMFFHKNCLKMDRRMDRRCFLV